MSGKSSKKQEGTDMKNKLTPTQRDLLQDVANGCPLLHRPTLTVEYHIGVQGTKEATVQKLESLGYLSRKRINIAMTQLHITDEGKQALADGK